MAELIRVPDGLDRRDFLTLAGASALALGAPAWASSAARYPAIRKAAEPLLRLLARRGLIGPRPGKGTGDR